nr:hypothetical protein [Tanacetum cinerariifolium]
LSLAKPTEDLSHTNRPSAPIIEEWVSDSEDDSEITAPQITYSSVQSTKQVTPPRHSVQPIEAPIPAAKPKPTSLKTSSSGKRKNRKTCFVCRSVDHLIKDCNFHAKPKSQPTPRNNTHRGYNKQHASFTKKFPQKHIVLAAVLPKSKPVYVIAVRPICADVPKIMMTRPRHAHSLNTRSNSTIIRHKTCSHSSNASNSSPKVTAAKAPVVSAPKGMKGKWVWRPKCPILDHDSRTTGEESVIRDPEEESSEKTPTKTESKDKGKGNFMPLKPDLAFHTVPIAIETNHSAFTIQLSLAKPAEDLSHTNRPSAPIIEECVSNSDDDSETTASQIAHSSVQSTKQVIPPRHYVQPIEEPIPAVTPKLTCPKTSCSVLPKSKPISITTVRPICANVSKIMMTRPIHAHSLNTRSNSTIRRHKTCSHSSNTSNSSLKVTTAKALVVSIAKGKKGKWVWRPKCPILDHDSRTTEEEPANFTLTAIPSSSSSDNETTAPQIVYSSVQSTKQVTPPRHYVQPVEAPIPAATPKPTSPKTSSSVPAAMLPKSKLVSVTAVRPICADVPKIMKTIPRHAHSLNTRSNLTIRMHKTYSHSLNTSNSSPKVTAAKALMVSAAKGKKGKWVWTPKCPILDHDSRTT